MSYESDSKMFDKMSGKKMAITFGLIFFAAFVFLQILWGFPLRDILIKESVTEVVPVSIKQDNLCVVETPDHPREMKDCTYNVGDHIVVTYNKNNAGIQSHHKE